MRRLVIALSLVLATALAWVGPGASFGLSHLAYAAATFTLTSPVVTSRGRFQPLTPAMVRVRARLSPGLHRAKEQRGTP